VYHTLHFLSSSTVARICMQYAILAQVCNLVIEDFSLGGLHNTSTGKCKTPGCQYQTVGSHPRRASIAVGPPVMDDQPVKSIAPWAAAQVLAGAPDD
jgi:hypothetical protein